MIFPLRADTKKTFSNEQIRMLAMRYLIIILTAIVVLFSACEETDLQLATEAGMDAIKAITLTDEQVQELALTSSRLTDQKHRVAPTTNTYNVRLKRLVRDHYREGNVTFNYKVYLSETINAFAMADGTIRIYSGLMDMMNDGELRFVIGHEMGHVVKEHIRKKIQLAYAASAVRKGIASQHSIVGNIARSQLGGFAELLMNAQFSQFEEKEADDYGLKFLQLEGYEAGSAVSALRKLATLGNDHSFLASHPAPGDRADRIQAQLEGRALSIEDKKKNLWQSSIEFLQEKWKSLKDFAGELLPAS